MTKTYNDTRVVTFSCICDGVYPATIDEVVKKMELVPIQGQAFINKDTYDLMILQPVKQIVDNEDLFVTKEGVVFSIGKDESALPEGIIREG